MKTLFLLFALAASPLLLLNDAGNSNNIFLEPKGNFVYDEVLSFGEHGVVTRLSKDLADGQGGELQFELYDTDFSFKASASCVLPHSRYFQKLYKSEKEAHFLFRQLNRIALVSVKIAPFSVALNEAKLPSESKITDMVVHNNKAILIGYRIKDPEGLKKPIYTVAPLMVSLDLTTGILEELPIAIGDQKESKLKLMSIQLVEDHKEIFLFARKKKNKRTVYVARLNGDGKITSVVDFALESPKEIESAHASVLPNGKLVFIGDYSEGSQVTKNGIYLYQLNGNTVDYTTTKSREDLNGFCETTAPVNEPDHPERRRVYRLLPHALHPLGDGYLLVAENQSEWRQKLKDTGFKTMMGAPVSNWYNGQLNSHAFVARFSQDGELIWTRCFKIHPPQLHPTAMHTIHVRKEGANAIQLSYISQFKLHRETINLDGEFLERSISNPITTNIITSKEEVKFSKIEHWYDDHFLAAGLNILNYSEGTTGAKEKRQVVFLKKLD